jgi:hypothetical protein
MTKRHQGTKVEEILAKCRCRKNWTIQFGILEYPIFPKEIDFD